ncbi:hypothetical protein SAMN05444521_2444 [Streptomyces sp. 3214.6]|nr:hypothetical protein SAMN05444521_2444 [Streptomyces sp. 3214.6]
MTQRRDELRISAAVASGSTSYVTTPRSPAAGPSKPSSGCAQVARCCRRSWKRRPRPGSRLGHGSHTAAVSSSSGPVLGRLNRLSTGLSDSTQALTAETAAGRPQQAVPQHLRIGTTVMGTGLDQADTSARSRPSARWSASDVRHRLGRGASAHFGPPPPTGGGRRSCNGAPAAGPRHAGAGYPAGGGTRHVRPRTRADAPACTPATTPASPLPFRKTAPSLLTAGSAGRR